MFSSQISSIESQIQELSRKADQYRALDSEMISVVDAIYFWQIALIQKFNAN